MGQRIIRSFPKLIQWDHIASTIEWSSGIVHGSTDHSVFIQKCELGATSSGLAWKYLYPLTKEARGTCYTSSPTSYKGLVIISEAYGQWLSRAKDFWEIELLCPCNLGELEYLRSWWPLEEEVLVTLRGVDPPSLVYGVVTTWYAGDKETSLLVDKYHIEDDTKVTERVGQWWWAKVGYNTHLDYWDPWWQA